MTKKEFKKKCKKEKTLSYKLMISGEIISTIGLILVIITLFFVKTFAFQIIGFALSGTLACVGMTLDIIGEIILSKEFKRLNA